MEKRTEFNRTRVEVCRNCSAEGTVEVDSFSGRHRVKCPICGGSGLVKKRTVGTVTVEPYEKTPTA